MAIPSRDNIILILWRNIFIMICEKIIDWLMILDDRLNSSNVLTHVLEIWILDFWIEI